jgi:hypothetical protein
MEEQMEASISSCGGRVRCLKEIPGKPFDNVACKIAQDKLARKTARIAELEPGCKAAKEALDREADKLDASGQPLKGQENEYKSKYQAWRKACDEYDYSKHDIPKLIQELADTCNPMKEPYADTFVVPE